MKALFESRFIFFLLLHHAKAFRDHRPIRRRAVTAEEGRGGSFLEGSIDVQPNQIRLYAGTQDPIDNWLGDVFDRYHISGTKRTSKSKSESYTLPKNKRHISSSRKKSMRSSADESNFSTRGEGLIGERVDPVDKWLNNIFDRNDVSGQKLISSSKSKSHVSTKNSIESSSRKNSIGKDDRFDDWLSNIYCHYNLPEMPSASMSSKTIGTLSKKASSGKKRKSSSGTAAYPIDEWLSNIYDRYDIAPGVSSSSKTSSDKKSTKSKCRGRSKKSNGKRSSKQGSHTRKPSLPSASATNGPSFSPSINAPVDTLAPITLTLAPASVPSAPVPIPTVPTSLPIEVPSDPGTRSPTAPTVPFAPPVPGPVSPPVPRPVSPPVPLPVSPPMPSPQSVPVTQSPVKAPSTTTDAPMQGPTSQSRAPSAGTVVRSQVCSTYETTNGNPSDKDFNEAAFLTCAHLEQYIATTFELGAPFILLDDMFCSDFSTTTDPHRICYEIAVTFAEDSEVLPAQGDVDSLICIAFLPPEVEDLLADLSSLMVSNPFSTTTELTCDIAAVTDAPTDFPTAAPADPQTFAPVIPTEAPIGITPNPVVVPSTEAPSVTSTKSPTDVTPAPGAAPILATEAPIQLPTTQIRAAPGSRAQTPSPSDGPMETPGRSPATGTVIDSSPFFVSYDVTGVPDATNFNEAGLLTCEHIVDVLTSFFDSPFTILEKTYCTPVATSTNPTWIEFEVTSIFARESVAIPEAGVDALIKSAFSRPIDEELMEDLNALPSTNPFSTTSAISYQVLLRNLIDESFSVSSASDSQHKGLVSLLLYAASFFLLLGG